MFFPMYAVLSQSLIDAIRADRELKRGEVRQIFLEVNG